LLGPLALALLTLFQLSVLNYGRLPLNYDTNYHLMKKINDQSQEVANLAALLEQLCLSTVSLKEIAPKVPQIDLLPFLDIVKNGANNYVIIDVRSQREFSETPIPYAINIPILTDKERHDVGLIYSKVSKAKAINYAYHLATLKESDFLKQVARSSDNGKKKIIVFCWRGGGRSRYSTNLLQKNNFDAIQLAGGQKEFRRLVHHYMYETKFKIISLSGKTGCGKSEILEYLEENHPTFPVLHIERAAGHASSVFGEVRFKLKGIAMPINQQMFETNLFLQILPFKDRLPVFLSEKESKRIGKFSIPPAIFDALEEEHHILLECPLALRLARLEKEYFKNQEATAQVREQISYIAKRLGPARTNMLYAFIDNGEYQKFLDDMMVNYYDLNYKKTVKSPMATVDHLNTQKAVEQIMNVIKKQDDKYLWLEEVLSEDSISWVKEKNQTTLKPLTSHPEFAKLESDILKILESKEKIPYVYMNGEYLYNTWYDDEHTQGLLRRTTLEEYKKNNSNWETVIDFDQLSNIEKIKWVPKGFTISPNQKRALIYMSPGGCDANIIREFDLTKLQFVPDGLVLPKSKGSAVWLDDDTILISRDFGEGTLTASGYPRTIRRWKRNSTLSSAKTVFEISKNDTFAFQRSFYLPNNPEHKIILMRNIDFYHSEFFLFNEETSKTEQIDLPQMCDYLGHTLTSLFVTIKENWREFCQGDLLHYDFQTKTIELILRPAKNSSIHTTAISKNGIFVIINENIKGNLYFYTKSSSAWQSHHLKLPSEGSLEALTTDATNDNFFVMYSSFNTPPSYYFGTGVETFSVVKIQPAFFDYKNIEVHQYFVKSFDDTAIPYFLVHKKGLVFNGNTPTILYGYGGFEVSLCPEFSNVEGIAWLEKGGVYVLANIRGGGEYGPTWHQCALKENRYKTYEDFFAIAQDLFAKKITSPRHLGAWGGSNGGLLMGVCYTQRPDLFAAINCAVPLLDMRRYHKLLAGHSWIAEYGNPDDEKDGEYIRKISPYHCVEKDLPPNKKYPTIFLNTSTKDDRVHPGHARKFAAKLEELHHQFYYYENIDGGHAGHANLKQLAFKHALDYIFFWKELT